MSSPISNDTLLIEHVFNAPPDRVFRAWTEPGALLRWFAPEGFHLVVAEVDLRVGGVYRLGLQSQDGNIHHITGTYREIQPSQKLVFTWTWASEPSQSEEGVMLVTVELTDNGNTTRMMLTHERLPSQASLESHAQGWDACFVQLDKFLAIP